MLHPFLSRLIRARLPALAWLVLAISVAAAGTPMAAWAHASLIRVEPADGSVLDVPPAQATLVFNEPVSPLAMRLVGSEGDVALNDVRARDETVSMPLPPGLARGTHLLSWRVISADGHPVGGTVVFSVGEPGTRPADPARSVAPGLQPAIWLTGLALLAGLLFGIGGLVFDAWRSKMEETSQAGAEFPGAARHPSGGEAPLARDGTAPLPWLVLALLAAPVSLGLQGVDALGASLAAMRHAPVWRTALGTSYGMLVAGAMAAALTGVLTCALRHGAARKFLAGLSMLLFGAALASSGHAATAQSGGLSRLAVFVHVVMAACWLGALVRLPAALRARDGAATLRRFSTAAVWLMALLVVSGATLAYWQLTRVQDLWRTAYGQVLAVKLALVAGLLALAAVNRWRLTAPALRAQAAPMRALIRNIRAEWVLAVLVLAVVGLWRFTPPPRALQAGTTIALHLHGADAMADVAILSRPGGHAHITAVVTNAAYVPIQPLQVSLLFSNTAAGVEPIRREAHRGADGAWEVDDAPLPVAGRWTVRLEALITDFDRVSLQGDVDIAGMPQ